MLKQSKLVMILQSLGQTLAASTMHRERSGWPYIILKRFTLLASPLNLLSLLQAVQLDPTFLDAYINLGNVLKEARIFERYYIMLCICIVNILIV